MNASGGRAERRVSADTEASLEHLTPQERQHAKLLLHLHEYAISSADETRLLVDGGAFFAVLGQRIDEAQHHIHVEFYIWQDDARANEMLDRLVAAARRGVEVRLLFDPIGCFGLRRSHFARLVEAGGKFAWFRTAHPLRNQWTFTLRNHRKSRSSIAHTVLSAG